jgi:hypothetical protein
LPTLGRCGRPFHAVHGRTANDVASFSAEASPPRARRPTHSLTFFSIAPADVQVLEDADGQE